MKRGRLAIIILVVIFLGVLFWKTLKPSHVLPQARGWQPARLNHPLELGDQPCYTCKGSA